MPTTFTVHNKVKLLDTLIKKSDVVLDVGFWGQGKTYESPTWPHKLIKDRAGDVYGLDIVYEESVLPSADLHKYIKAAAEDFTFDKLLEIDLYEKSSFKSEPIHWKQLLCLFERKGEF